MYTFNAIEMACPMPVAFMYARQVENWPDLLSHYRWVRFHRGESWNGGTVEMAAIRRFGPFSWPVWWISEMKIDHESSTVRYRHIDGITRGMEVEWKLAPTERGTKVVIVHTWQKPVVGSLIGRKVVGPIFVHTIADQTLAGLKQKVEVVSNG